MGHILHSQDLLAKDTLGIIYLPVEREGEENTKIATTYKTGDNLNYCNNTEREIGQFVVLFFFSFRPKS